ncbi:MAG TPA: hypothetical protein VGM10_22130 [Actinocrinis sp.]|jgi:hypothetical protein
MSELDAANQIVRDSMQFGREVVENAREVIDMAKAAAEGRGIEADGRAEQHELQAGHQPEAAAAQPEYQSGAELPPQAQADAPWTFGEPPAAQFSGSFDWSDLGAGPGKTT